MSLGSRIDRLFGRKSVIEEFLGAEEYRTRARETVEIERFVRTLYRTLLHREPDSAGFEEWVTQMSAGKMTHTDVIERIISSEEYRAIQGVDVYRAPGHFYSPIVNPGDVEQYLEKVELARQSDTLIDITVDRAAMVRYWHELLPFMQTAPFAEKPINGLRFGFENPSYCWGDASVLHGTLRLHRTKRFIEIGSGYSSLCTIETVKHFLNGNCKISLIEPYPRI